MNQTIENLNKLSNKFSDIHSEDDKLTVIQETDVLCKNTQEQLDKITEDIDNYKPTNIQVGSIDETITKIKETLENIDNMDLEDSIILYKQAMNEIFSIQNYINKETKEYEVVE